MKSEIRNKKSAGGKGRLQALSSNAVKEANTAVRLNKEWHLTHPMPKNATMEQRIAWHKEHVKYCACRPMPEGVKQAIKENQKIEIGNKKSVGGEGRLQAANTAAKKRRSAVVAEMAPKKVAAKVFKFKAKIKDAGGGGAYVEFPYDTETIFGTRGMVKVNVTFDGHPYRGSLAAMGGPCHLVPILKSVRAAIGKQPGDTVTVTVARDSEPRTVTVPPDFKKALAKNKSAKEFFEKSSYTCRKEYVQWIEEAKKPETRERRIAKAVEMLAEGKRYS